MTAKFLFRSGQVLCVLVVVLFWSATVANAIWVGGNIDVHNNTGKDAYDFHIRGVIKSTCEPKLPIRFGWADGISFGKFDHNITHAGEDLWKFDATWSDPTAPIPTSSVGHFGLFFQVCCRNVWVDLDGWWTDKDGGRIGSWPILGFEVPNHWWDPADKQFFRLRGDAGGDKITFDKIEAMFFLRMAPPTDGKEAEDLFRRLNADDWRRLGTWVQVTPPSGEFGPDSFFDVFVDVTNGMKPNELLLVATSATWTTKSGEKETRWFFHAHQAHPPYVKVKIDIKPGSCPNPFNGKSKGLVPVAVVGSSDFDVSKINPKTVTLEGVFADHWAIEDVTKPYEGELKDCFDCLEGDSEDGIPDLVLHFPTSKLANVPILAKAGRDDCVRLFLMGMTYDGVLFRGMDLMIVRTKVKSAPSNYNNLSTLWGEIKAK